MDAPVSSSQYTPSEDKPSTPLSTGKLQHGGSSSNAKKKSERRRRALVDRTNDSPILGLVPGIPTSPSYSICSSSEGSSMGEDLLRFQVKSLLQKVEHEGSRFPLLRTLSQLNGFLSSPSRNANSFNQPIGLPTTPTLLFGQRCRLANTISRFQGCSILEAEVQEGRSVYVDLGIHSPDDSSASEAEPEPKLPSDSQSKNMNNKYDQGSRAAKGITRILRFDSPEKTSNSILPFSIHTSSCRSSCLDPDNWQIESGAKLKQLGEVHKVGKHHVLSSLGKRIVFSTFKQNIENADGSVTDVGKDLNTKAAEFVECKDLKHGLAKKDIQFPKETNQSINRDNATKNTSKGFQIESAHKPMIACDMPELINDTRKKAFSSRLRAYI